MDNFPVTRDPAGLGEADGDKLVGELEVGLKVVGITVGDQVCPSPFVGTLDTGASVGEPEGETDVGVAEGAADVGTSEGAAEAVGVPVGATDSVGANESVGVDVGATLNGLELVGTAVGPAVVGA